MNLHVVQLENIPILEQLQWEEALLRADQRNWCLINHGSPPAIVMGISGQPDQLIEQERLQITPLPIIRRFSGGGTVVVDKHTFFVTFIFNTSALPVAAFPAPIMQWTAQVYQPLFHFLPFKLHENDYVLGEKKFGGNAQSITKDRWLHHSSMLYDYDPVLMNCLKIPSKAPLYRKQRSHEDFVCCLRPYWPTLNHLKKDLVKCLTNQFTVNFMCLEELQKIASLPHRKATRVEMR